MNILELTFEQLTHQLKQDFDKGNYHARAIYKQVFRNGNTDFEKVNEFSRSNGLARKLNNAITCNLWPVVSKHKTNGVTKFVTKLKDGLEIESVIVPMSNYYTICISSQVGCKMKCSFCETARLGLLRNLTVEEIVGQVYTAKIIFKMDIRNIVFMGMGEPFDNFENVTQSIKILSEQRGLDFPKKRITISTIGKIDGIKKLAKLNWPELNLAVSVNAPNDTIRSAIMPFNKTAPMAELRKALMEYPLKKSKVLYIEYVLIKHVNDSRLHAKEIAEFLKPLKAKLNLISYNTSSGNHFISPLHEDLIRFRNWLVEEKVFVRIRTEKGRELLAACGQLGNKKIRTMIADANVLMQ